MKMWVYGLLVCLPLKALRVNSAYGFRTDPLTGKIRFHDGVDFYARSDTVFAALGGKAVEVGYSGKLGNRVVLKHNDILTIYGHLSQFFILPGDEVEAGAPIAITGLTGRVTGEHLHFSVSYRNRYINPIKFLKMLLRTNSSD